MPRIENLFGAERGYQAQKGTMLGQQFPQRPDDPKAYHGAPVAGIDEIKPASEVGWANHEASHPQKVYAAVREHDAWDQAVGAGSKRLGEHLNEHGVVPDIADAPNPTVYDVTLRGDVDTDPEYDALGDGMRAVRGNRGAVNAEIPMPPNSQGTLLPDYFGRTGSFAEGFRGTVISEDTADTMSGARFEKFVGRVDRNAVLYDQESQIDIVEDAKVPARQMERFRRDIDVQREMNYGDYTGDPVIKDAARHETKNPRLFDLRDVAEVSNNFPYGKPAGWGERRTAFVDEAVRAKEERDARVQRRL